VAWATKTFGVSASQAFHIFWNLEVALNKKIAPDDVADAIDAYLAQSEAATTEPMNV
jgi:hypothetical protein